MARMRVEGFSLSPRLTAELPLVFNVAHGHTLPAGPRPSLRYEAARYTEDIAGPQSPMA
jgi:lipopolysaccharide/colanic/teichoic acid biosynthesis glycosyltransferase